VIKKIKIELFVVVILLINIFIFNNVDIGLYQKFKGFINSLNNIYFKEFFVNLTVLGDSLWVFVLCFFGFLFSFFLKNKLEKKFQVFNNKINIFFLFLFLGTLITGVLTQTIKHVVGRPRPNHAIDNGSFSFDFFNLDSAFHSFPSGHSSTIFLVALVLSLYTPRIKYFYLFFASLVALSRVAVGAHYFADIVGGAVIAFIGIKITLFLFDKFNTIKNISRAIVLDSSLFLLSLIVFFFSIVFISVGSSLDIYFSNMFYYGNKQFFLQSFDLITILTRKFFLSILLIYILALPILSLSLPIKKIYFNFDFKLKNILFIFSSLIINLLFVVNLILKNFWGRARPNDILQLGGKEHFTPWYEYSNACLTNCSFVSGDASVGFSLIVLYFITKNKNFIWASVFSGVFIGFVRILEGGHFFSDVLIAGFLIFILTSLQFWFYDKIFKHDS
tara:strand:- start:2788 stop:4125 length:1338 start_codon:yes stop_codon:yes gene_type:complete